MWPEHEIPSKIETFVGNADVIILKIFSPKKWRQKLAFFAQTTASFLDKMIVTLFFLEKTPFFRRKLAKLAENCDHNIDPCVARWYIFIPKIKIGVHLGWSWN
jgi:hypothetical protein